MERAIDKLLLYFYVLFLLSQRYEGNAFVNAIYMSLALAAAMLWLIPAERKVPAEDSDPAEKWLRYITFLIPDLILVFSFFFPNLIALCPLLVYDLYLIWHVPGFVLAGFSVILSLSSQGGSDVFGIQFYIFLAAGIFLAVWIARKTMKIYADEKQLKTLRDDYAEQKKKLMLQNSHLLEAKDREVLTTQLTERNRIAREIHDNVGHTLSRALLQVGALLAIHKEEPAHTELSEVRKTLDSAMTNIRTSVHDLHDSSVNLEGTVQQIMEPLREKFHVNTEIDVSEDMPREIKYGVIGIIREGVSNILSHSLNDTVLLQVLEHPAFYQVILHDYLSSEGTLRERPVTERESGESGIGLINIQNRVQKMKGTLQISEESGFRIFVSVSKQNWDT